MTSPTDAIQLIREALEHGKINLKYSGDQRVFNAALTALQTLTAASVPKCGTETGYDNILESLRRVDQSPALTVFKDGEYMLWGLTDAKYAEGDVMEGWLCTIPLPKAYDTKEMAEFIQSLRGPAASVPERAGADNEHFARQQSPAQPEPLDDERIDIIPALKAMRANTESGEDHCTLTAAIVALEDMQPEPQGVREVGDCDVEDCPIIDQIRELLRLYDAAAGQHLSGPKCKAMFSAWRELDFPETVKFFRAALRLTAKKDVEDHEKWKEGWGDAMNWCEANDLIKDDVVIPKYTPAPEPADGGGEMYQSRGIGKIAYALQRSLTLAKSDDEKALYHRALQILNNLATPHPAKAGDKVCADGGKPGWIGGRVRPLPDNRIGLTLSDTEHVLTHTQAVAIATRLLAASPAAMEKGEG